MIGLFDRLCCGINTQLMSKRVAGDEEALPAKTPKVSPKYVVPAIAPVRPSVPVNTVEMEPWSSRHHRTSTSQGIGRKFPVLETPKIDILVFKGDEDVLN